MRRRDVTNRFGEADVRAFYDRQTPAFLARGQGGNLGAIHRAVWGPGVHTRAEAFRYVEDRIADLIREQMATCPDPLHVYDLGCGVGASLCHLAQQFPIRGTGVTLSPVQADLAAQRIRASGLADRVRCLQGSYLTLPSNGSAAHVAYAIEAFVHASSPVQFFAECHRLLAPGGTLVLCDDFRQGAIADRAALTMLDRFRHGWRINALLDLDELVEMARVHGFATESVADLTPWLELHRFRDRFLALAAGIANTLLGAEGSARRPALDRWLNTHCGHWLGGSALQTCLARGWIKYALVVFRRQRGEVRNVASTG